MSESLELAKGFLGKEVHVVFDRPLGTDHPRHGFRYEVNYGYVPETKAPDGAELDAYYLGTNTPLSEAIGDCIAIVHRVDDDDDKLVVVPSGTWLNDQQIGEQVRFQEQWFKTEIVRD